MGIWEILFWVWLVSGICTNILLRFPAFQHMDFLQDEDTDPDDKKWGWLVYFIPGPLGTAFIIFAFVMEKKADEEEEEEDRLKALKRKEQKANAISKSIKRYPELLLNLEKQWKSYEASGDIPSQKFIKDVNALGKDACIIPKESVENKDVLLEILRYGRINIYSAFEGDALKQGEKIAKSLGSSLKKLSK